MKTQKNHYQSPIRGLMRLVLVSLVIGLQAPLMAEPEDADNKAEQLAEKIREDLKNNNEALQGLIRRAMENGGKLELDADEFEKLMGKPAEIDEKSGELGEDLSEFLNKMRKEGGPSRVLSPDEVERLLGKNQERLRKNTAAEDEPGEEKSGAADAMKGFLEMFQRQMRGRKAGENEREHGSILQDYRPVVGKARQSTVAIMAGRKQVALGTVVDSAGYVLTKASEVQRSGLRCVFPGGVRVAAEVVDVYEPLDLALVRVGADGLEPVEWASDDPVELGTFLAAPGVDEDPIAIGVASVAPRNLSEKRKGFLGVTPEGDGANVRIAEVIPGMPAADAGLEKGDIVISIDGTEVGSRAGFHRMIGDRSPGEVLEFRIRRGEEEKTLTAKLVSRDVLTQLRGGNPSNSRIDRMNEMGGDLSDNRAGYPSALQTDLTLDPAECGGPVVNLDGKVIGVNIARGGRVKSYAVPARDLKALLGDVRSGKFTITDLSELKEAATAADEALKAAEAALEAAREAKRAADEALKSAADKQ